MAPGASSTAALFQRNLLPVAALRAFQRMTGAAIILATLGAGFVRGRTDKMQRVVAHHSNRIRREAEFARGRLDSLCDRVPIEMKPPLTFSPLYEQPKPLDWHDQFLSLNPLQCNSHRVLLLQVRNFRLILACDRFNAQPFTSDLACLLFQAAQRFLAQVIVVIEQAPKPAFKTALQACEDGPIFRRTRGGKPRRTALPNPTASHNGGRSRWRGANRSGP